MHYELPLVESQETILSRRQRIVKRTLDLTVTFILLVVGLPVMAFLALVIWLWDGGPILYRQVRVGERGRPFTMYKFRTMIAGGEELQPLTTRRNDLRSIVHKTEDDPRVTPVGRLLRRTSLDELPQLFNVWRGEMSLVGPRPELPWLVARYERWQYRRLSVPQGITGLWQISGRARNLMHLSTGIDIQYVENYSLWLDLSILLKTPLVVLHGDGAY